MQQPYQNKKFAEDKSRVVTLEKGKIPPQAIDLEEAVIGTSMMFQNAFAEVVEILSDQVNVFYKQKHKYIFSAMLEMYAEDQSIDLLTVSQKLKSDDKLELVGGDFYLIQLTQRLSSSAHLEDHCRILMQKYVKRESIIVASEITENAYDESSDIFDVLENAQNSLDETSQWLLRKKPENLKTIYEKLLNNSENPQASIPSKFKKINERTNGYHPNDLVVVAARPGMGKTAYVINEAKAQAEQNIPVGFLSLEMSDVELLGRLIAIEFGIESSRIKQNQLTPSEKEVVKRERSKIDQLPLYIHAGSETTTMEAKTIIGKWVRQFGVRIVYIDYLQLMRSYEKSASGNREQEIAYISRKLKAIAKDFQITVVALSQLSRAVEQRGGMKRPMLSDLRESGAIEQDANVVQFLLRPEYYNIDEWDDENRTPTAGQMEVFTAKTREGKTGATYIGHNLKYMRFNDLEDPDTKWNDNEFVTATEPSDAFEPPADGSVVDDDEDLPF